MKSRKKIKSIVVIATVAIVSLFFINISFAANTAKVNVETANLRETPDENSKILELLSNNQEVEVIEKTGNWYKIKANGITGYLREDLISVNEEITNNSNSSNNVENDINTNEQVQVEENTEIGQTATTEKTEVELGKQIVVEDTKLKIVPVINATDIVEVKKDEEVNVIEIMNGWACIETTTAKGWIRKEKLKKQEEQIEQPQVTVEQQEEQPVQTVTKTLYVNSTTVNLRKEANTTSEIVTTLPINTEVEVISEADGWCNVKANGKEGYISSSLLSTTKQETSRSAETRRKAEKEEEQSTTSTTSESSGKGSAVVETALQYVGCSYVYGGTSPSGFDCSGFTYYVYKLHGVTLNRTAAGQYSNGVAVNKSDLQPGDLVMFGKSGINHVGIYIGGGEMVHAANPSRGVTTDTINSGYYYNNYVGARRVI